MNKEQRLSICHHISLFSHSLEKCPIQQFILVVTLADVISLRPHPPTPGPWPKIFLHSICTSPVILKIQAIISLLVIFKAWQTMTGLVLKARGQVGGGGSNSQQPVNLPGPVSNSSCFMLTAVSPAMPDGITTPTSGRCPKPWSGIFFLGHLA